MASVDPTRGAEALSEARRLIARGVKGFKLHPPLQQFHANDKIAYPFYEVIAEASTTPLLISTVKSGLGVTILPLSAISEEPPGSIQAARITNPSLTRELSLCSSAVSPLSLASEKVREVLIELLQTLVVTKKWKGARIIGPKVPK